jgi:TolA-binding protein
MKYFVIVILFSLTLFGCASTQYKGPKLSEVMANQCYGINQYDKYVVCLTNEWLTHVKASELYKQENARERVTDFELRMKELSFAIKNGVMSEAEAILKLGDHRRELAKEEESSYRGSGVNYQYTPPQQQNTNCISNRIGTQVITNCY